MSYHHATEPVCTPARGSVQLIIESKQKDLGGFAVRRVLPAAERRMIGPFIFFDHMGPAHFAPGQGIAVRPHPHIGIATITYLFEGEIIHRDSLGITQTIQAGAVNLMTAGRGIVHSERAGNDLNRHSTLHGIQSWIALPTSEQEIDPDFFHHPATDLPELNLNGVNIRIIMGQAFGHRSPVHQYSSTLYLDCELPAGSDLRLPRIYPELAIYVIDGDILIDGRSFKPGTMVVVRTEKEVCLQAHQNCRLVVIGGEPVGQRHIWWNFVSSSRARIEQAKSDWKERRFDAVPDETEFTPLPEAIDHSPDRTKSD